MFFKSCFDNPFLTVATFYNLKIYEIIK